jgi:hypothetical protein
MPGVRLVALLLIVLSASAVAGQRATPRPATGATDGVLSERFKRLDTVLQEHVDRSRIAGIVVLVRHEAWR